MMMNADNDDVESDDADADDDDEDDDEDDDDDDESGKNDKVVSLPTSSSIRLPTKCHITSHCAV